MSDNTTDLSTTEAPETEEAQDFEDFDAFWSTAKKAGPRIKIRGQVLELASSIPLAFEMESKRLQRAKDTNSTQRMLSLLGFPEDVMSAWADAGMGADEFAVLLAYSTARVAGKDITMQEAHDEVQRRMNEKSASGKARARKS